MTVQITANQVNNWNWKKRINKIANLVNSNNSFSLEPFELGINLSSISFISSSNRTTN
jgi:hypothetical protein